MAGNDIDGSQVPGDNPYGFALIAQIYAPWSPTDRFIVCWSARLMQQRRRNRQRLLTATARGLETIRKDVQGGRLSKAEEICLRIHAVIKHWRTGRYFELTVEDGCFEYHLKEERITQEEELDGMYVIRTDL